MIEAIKGQSVWKTLRKDSEKVYFKFSPFMKCLPKYVHHTLLNGEFYFVVHFKNVRDSKVYFVVRFIQISLSVGMV